MTPTELALCLFWRMVTGTPVWVDSPAGQQTRIVMLSNDDGVLVAFDEDGNDRLLTDYLLNPKEAK